MSDIVEPVGEPPIASETLETVRTRIEAIDAQLVGMLAERASLACAARAVKQRLGLPILDPAREAAVVRRAGRLARAAALPEELVRDLYWTILALSRDVQQAAGR